MGIGNLQNVLSDYDAGSPVPYTQLYFDTALYNVESLELLFKVVGPDRCLFGTERPGAGSKTDPRTGRWYDDVRPQIESISWLNSEQKEQIFHNNAARVFTRFKQ